MMERGEFEQAFTVPADPDGKDRTGQGAKNTGSAAGYTETGGLRPLAIQEICLTKYRKQYKMN
jgi:hypothetical protein